MSSCDMQDGECRRQLSLWPVCGLCNLAGCGDSVRCGAMFCDHGLNPAWVWGHLIRQDPSVISPPQVFLFVFGCAGSSLLCGLFYSCSHWEHCSLVTALVSHYNGFSCCRTQALGSMGFSNCRVWALEHRLSSCGTWT